MHHIPEARRVRVNLDERLSLVRVAPRREHVAADRRGECYRHRRENSSRDGEEMRREHEIDGRTLGAEQSPHLVEMPMDVPDTIGKAVRAKGSIDLAEEQL